MYASFAEHKFNSILPKHTAKAAQRIRKARSRLARIPRLNKKVSPLRFLLKIPEPDHGINPQAQSCRSFGTFAFPCLRLLTTDKLLGVFESMLDAASGRIRQCSTEYRTVESSHRHWTKKRGQITKKNMCGNENEDPNCNNSYGKTTAHMKQQSTFTDWDLINVWNIGENQTYPYLRTHGASDINKDNITNFLDLCIVAEQWCEEQ